MKTSRTRPPAEMGFLTCEETVNSCVVLQNAALPNVLISVCAEWRSSTNATIAQNRSTPTVVIVIVTRCHAAGDAWPSPHGERPKTRGQPTPALDAASVNP